MSAVVILIESDYDGYFHRLVEEWVEEKMDAGKEFKHERIVVSAGPYRSSAVSYRSIDTTIFLDFYAALRAGFGELSNADIQAIIELL